MLSWVSLRLTAPANCINSTFVENIDIADSGEIYRIENCSLYTRAFGPIVPERSFAQRLIYRVNHFERAAFIWQRPKEKITIKISNEPLDLNVKGTELVIGPERLESSQDLELGLLSLTSVQKDPMVREVIARFFWSLIEPKHSRLRPWPSYLKTLAGYCMDDNHLLVHREFCDLRKELGDGLVADDVDDGAVGWSLLPLLTDTVKFLYARLPDADRARFLERIFFLASFEDESLFSPELRTLGDIEQRYFELLKLWLMPLDIDSKSFNEIKKVSSLYSPTYVYVVNNSGEALDLPKSEMRHAIVETGGRKTFALSDVAFNVSRTEIFNSLEVKEVIVVGCKIPEPRRLLEFSPWVRKVFFIQKCKEESLDLAGLVDEGALKFAVRHTKLKVFEFNLRSLRMAQEWRGPLRGNSLQDWSKWLKWQSVTEDSNSLFYRPLGTFDAISRFRDPEQKKLPSSIN
jgi:hypothetical protein